MHTLRIATNVFLQAPTKKLSDALTADVGKYGPMMIVLDPALPASTVVIQDGDKELVRLIG